jgi:hypothetical protein
MAYEIRLYCSISGVSAVEGLDAVLSQTKADGAELQSSSRSSGDGWVAAAIDQVGDVPGARGCRVEFHSASPLVEKAVAEVASEDLSGRVRNADAIVILTLSGDVRWVIVKAIWVAARTLWEVIPYDDGSGFDVDLDEL